MKTLKSKQELIDNAYLSDEEFNNVDIPLRDIRLGALPPITRLFPKNNERLYTMSGISALSFISAIDIFGLSYPLSGGIAAMSTILVPLIGRFDTLGKRLGYIGDIPKIISAPDYNSMSNEVINHQISAIVKGHTKNPNLIATEVRTHQFYIFKIKNNDPKPISSAKGKIAISLGVDEDEVIFYQTYEKNTSAFLVPLPENEWKPVSFKDTYFKENKLIEYIGEDLKCNPILIDRRMFPHTLYAGITNSGKSMGMLASIESMKHSGYKSEIYIFDPKYDFGDIDCKMCVNETADGIEMMKDLSERAFQRRQKYAAAGCKNYFEYVEKVDNNEPLLLLYVDELAAMIESDKELSKDAIAVLSMIVRRDRAGGLLGTFATQRPDAGIITGEFKSNLGAIICFSCGNDVSSRVVLDSSVASSLPMYGGCAVKTAGSKKITLGRGCLV